MAKHVKHIRFVTATSDTYKGHDGELTVDTSKKVVVVHDNAKIGGYPQAREDLSNVAAATINIAGKMSSAQVIQLNEATADIITNTADIATNTANIATNTTNIATNAANIATNAADIAELQILNGVTETASAATRTVVAADQNKIIELNHATMVCTLDLIATIAAAVNVESFRVTLRNINNADATIQVTAPNTMDVDAVGNSTSMVLSKNQSITLGISTSQTNWMKVSSGAAIGPATSVEVHDLTVVTDLTVGGNQTINGDLEVIGDAKIIHPAVLDNAVVQNTNGSLVDAGVPLAVIAQDITSEVALNAYFGTFNMAHALGVVPQFVNIVLVCVTPNNGYLVGDEVSVSSWLGNSSSSDNNTRGAWTYRATTTSVIFYGSQKTSNAGDTPLVPVKNPTAVENYFSLQFNGTWNLKAYVLAVTGVVAAGA